jgi:hypothetical protein
MKEKKNQFEQYFFDADTVAQLADAVADFPCPCCLCAPTIGGELSRRGVDCAVLDADSRWSALKGFQRYEIRRPKRLDESFGVIVADPPFFSVSLGELFKAIRYLSHGEESQPILFCHLVRRGPEIVERFARYRVEPIAYYPGYQTVQNNGIQFFGNLGAERHERLAAANTRKLTDTPQRP